jgi:hypothetical protein
VTRATIISGLRRAILQLVPPERRREARLLLAALEDQYAAVMSTTEQQAYQEGLTAGKQPDSDTGYRDGWQRGYENAIKDVMGRIGSPARTPHAGPNCEEPALPTS